jgi:hypothetical protein
VRSGGSILDGTHTAKCEFKDMSPDPKEQSTLPEWVQSIDTRLRHELNGDMSDMPERLLVTLLRLFHRGNPDVTANLPEIDPRKFRAISQIRTCTARDQELVGVSPLEPATIPQRY